jgi:AraC-like DNA-binding protein/mannose-6-phosphate isomerase-like protein (cupin superfamily)
VKRLLQTRNYGFTYAESLVESHVLWDSHCHARYEMIAVLEGDITVMSEGRSHRLTEGCILMIPPLCYHTVTANKSGSYKRVTVLFDITAVPLPLREAFRTADGNPPLLTSAIPADMRICLQEDSPTLYEPLLESLMIPLFYQRLQAPADGDGEVEADDFILKIVEYVDRHLEEKIRLADLARHTARSASFVAHRFEEGMGISPGQYILRKKMAYAQKLIREGSPATLVAVRIGYRNYGTFYRLYRKHFGIKPSDTGLEEADRPRNVPDGSLPRPPADTEPLLP